MKSVDGGHTISLTVTPAGASIDSSVGISSGSRGLFDWVWRPSGRDTRKAARTVSPAFALACSTSGTTVALGRPACASAELAAQRTPRKQRTQRKKPKRTVLVLCVLGVLCVGSALIITPVSMG